MLSLHRAASPGCRSNDRGCEPRTPWAYPFLRRFCCAPTMIDKARQFLLVALNGPPGMSVQCPLSAVKQTSRHKAATSAYDPKRTWRQRGSLLTQGGHYAVCR